MQRAVKIIIYLNFILIICGPCVSPANAQADGKRVVAIITDSTGNQRNVLYSDLLFQLALQPQVPLDTPKTGDLKHVLQIMVNLSLIGGEINIGKIPCSIATEADVGNEIKRQLTFYRSPAEFEERLKLIGFVSLQDDNFKRQMGFRTSIQKWLDWRFHTFVIITPEEEESYYRNVFAPEFRRRNPGVLIPGLPERQGQIRQILTQQKAETEINRFLEYARTRAKIVILDDELK